MVTVTRIASYRFKRVSSCLASAAVLLATAAPCAAQQSMGSSRPAVVRLAQPAGVPFQLSPESGADARITRRPAPVYRERVGSSWRQVEPSSTGSLRRKALIGAALGGIAGGLVGAYICREIRAPERHGSADRNCWRAGLAAGVIGAGVGVVAVIGIDAATSRRSPGLAVRVRF